MNKSTIKPGGNFRKNHNILFLGMLILSGLVYLLIHEISQMKQDPQLFLISWGASAFISFLYALLIYALDRHEKSSLKVLAQAFLLGAFASTTLNGLIRGYLMMNPGVLSSITPEDWVIFEKTVFTPVLEETVKGVMLFLLIWAWRNDFKGVLDGIILGALTGLGFAFVENSQILFSAGLNSGYAVFTQLYVIRVVLGSLAGHVAYSAMLGLGLGYVKESWKNKNLYTRAILLAMLAFIFSITAHGLWNRYVMPKSVYLTVILIGIPFLAFIAMRITFIWKRNIKIYKTHLKDEVASGLIREHHLEEILDWRKRVQQYWSVFIQEGFARVLLLRKLYRSISGLAFQKWQLMAIDQNNKSDSLIEQYRSTIRNLMPSFTTIKRNRGKGIRFVFAISILCAMVGVLFFNLYLTVDGLANAQLTQLDARMLLNSQTLINDSQRSDDSDGDGLTNDLEYYIATTYAPLLVFDEGEDENVWDTLVPLYQVSPVRHWSGQDGAMLVFTFLYDNDYGADFDQDWSDLLSDPWNTGCSLAGDPFDSFFGTHCGDTEAIFFFIGQWNNWQSTRLLYIYWKRHYDPVYETSETTVEYDDFGTGGNRTHPIIYVSEDKHGMYPSHDECEDYKTDVLWEKAYIPCWPKMEDCSDGGSMQITYLPAQWNVGESISEATKNRAALNGTYYQGYDPWENEDFMGRTDIYKTCTATGGGLGGKWCGSPYAGDNHPCSGPNWWGQSGGASTTGSCMEYDTDRFGSDYRLIEMVTADPFLCMQECVNDVNCVSFSYVRPGYQAANARCYLKNAAPAAYSNICCVSGLRSSCLQ